MVTAMKMKPSIDCGTILVRQMHPTKEHEKIALAFSALHKHVLVGFAL
jgi:hypothetical protein